MTLEAQEQTGVLPSEFTEAAHPAASVIEPPKVMVSVLLDADVLAWFQSEVTAPQDWQRQINGLLRHHMDSVQQMEAEWEAEQELAARMGQEQAGPNPA
jgi:uncharacterized protein (DUF4415 family)